MVTAIPTRKRKRRGMTEERLGWILTGPAVLVMAGVAFFPLVYAGWLSLHDVNLRYAYLDKPFIGLGNFIRLAADGRFWNAMRVTSIFAVVSVSIELVLGILIALLINRPFRGRGLVRASVLVPWALTTVVMARMWSWIFNSEYGVFNAIVKSLGLVDHYVAWTADHTVALWVAIGADIWKTTPFMALLLLAGLQTIPADLVEAAKVDGAGVWRRFWALTIPLLRPTILVAVLFRTLDAVRVFDLVFVLTGGGPGFATETLSVYTYRALFQNLEFGYGSALAVGNFVFVMLISFFFIKVLGTKAGRQ